MTHRTIWIALALAGCESTVAIDLTVEVPDDVASAWDRSAPGILQSNVWTNIAPVCGGEGFTARIDHYDPGCHEDGDVTVRAWILPVPPSWDAGFCDLVADPERGLALSPSLYPPEDLPALSPADPQGAVAARWEGTPICGAELQADIALGD